MSGLDHSYPSRSGWPFLLAFASGALLLPVLPGLPPVTPVLGAAVLLAWLGPDPGGRWAAAALVGLAWVSFHGQLAMEDRWPVARSGEVLEVSGQVVGLVETRDTRARFLLRTSPDQDPDLPRLIRVDWHWFTSLPRSGDEWRLELRLQAPRGRANPGGFDVSRWLLSEGIGASGVVTGTPVLVTRRATGTVDGKRRALAEWMQATTPDLEAAALHRALAVADRSSIPPTLADRLRRTGTAHLLAISGLHVGMVFAAVFLVVRWLTVLTGLTQGGRDPTRPAVLAGLIVALGYAVLAGFTLPTRRALVMLAAGALAVGLRRGIRPGHALLLALVLVLLVDPLAPLATGFWLSFAAVGVLIWGFAWRPGQQGWLAGLLRAQLLVAVGLLTLNVAIFGQFVPGAFAANLVAIPLVAFWILPALLLAVLIYLAGWAGLAEWPLLVSEAGLEILLRWLVMVDSFPGGWWPAPTASGVVVVLGMIGGLWLIAPRGVPGRPLALFLMAPLVVAGSGERGPGAFDVQVLDVGQGQAVLVTTATRTWLAGTGPGDGAGRDMVASTLEPVIRRKGQGRVDALVANPARRGFSGGTETLVARYDPPVIWSYPDNDAGFLPCRAGSKLEADGVSLTALHPGPGLPDLGDNSSCVVRIQGAGGSLLVVGAIDDAVEARLTRFGPDPAADVLVLSRHGHRAGTSGAFLDAVNPDLALVSVASGNRFELPHEEVRQRLLARSVPLVGTHECGALAVRFRPGRVPELDSARGRAGGFWNRDDRKRCPAGEPVLPASMSATP